MTCDKLDRFCQVGFAGAWHWPASGRSDAYCDVFYVCACVCAGEWWSGPCMCDGSLLNSCYLCQLWYMKPRDASTVTHKWCLWCLHQLCHVGMPMLTRCHWQCLDRLSQIFATLCKVCFYGWFYIENELNAGNFALDWIIGPCCRCNLGVLVRRFNISENM